MKRWIEDGKNVAEKMQIEELTAKLCNIRPGRICFMLLFINK